MSFDKHSNFNKQANFTEVKFGENKPVLEVELNELQQIQNEARADIIRDTIPSGFTQLGEIDYDYCLNNENKIKLKTDSVAYVNGYRINIPKDTIIDIEEAPKKDAREDLLFLEVWKEEVNSESKLTKEGGEGQPTISNTIKDTRYPIETTHRIALKWRVRHVANVDFSTYHMDGFSAGTSGRNPQVTAQGAEKFAYKPTHDSDGAGSFNRSDLLHLDDLGLYVTSLSRKLFKTVDGYVYAIPMFRLYRKPSCGKSIPFEYSKINPKVDYSKFAKLMREEKVERVITEKIQGRSLVNLVNYVNDDTRTIINKGNAHNVNIAPLKNNTKYTIFVNFTEEVTHTSFRVARPETFGSSNVYAPLGTKGLYKVVVTASSSATEWNSGKTNLYNFGDTNVTFDKYMILEGDYSEIDIQPFTGLKSLGEDDNNLIIVKNGILNDSTYDKTDGNQKLTTFSESTTVLSENEITPEIKANVVEEGENRALNKLNNKITTNGTGLVEFTSIKGKTIQNCYPKITSDVFTNFQGSLDGDYIYIQGGTEYKNAFISMSKCIIKPNTTYTMVVNVVENTLAQDLVLSSHHPDDVFSNPNAKVPKGTKGVQKYVVTSATQITGNMLGLRAFLSMNETGRVKFKIMLLAGNHADTPIEDLFFVDGIKSVGEKENNKVVVTSKGKNLFNPSQCVDGVALSQAENLYDDKSLFASDSIQVIPNSSVTVTKVRWGWLLDKNHRKIGGNFGDNNPNPKTLSIPNNCHYIRITASISDKHLVQVEQGQSATKYEPYKEYKQNIYLKEPLRSLPNNMCDEITGNKLIRKVGQETFRGADNENWCEITDRHKTDTLYFEIARIYNDNRSIYCSHFPTKLNGESSTVWSTDLEICNYDNHWKYLVFRIKRSKLRNHNVQGFKEWLSTNPVTVVYGLPNAKDEYLENVYEKESIKTYQLDAPLRSIPNGVKDEIKNGVLIRRCGEYTFTGNENMKVSAGGWEKATDVTTFEGGTGLPTDCVYEALESNKLLCSVLPWNYFSAQYNSASQDSRGIVGITTHPQGKFVISINKNQLETQNYEGFKKWLQANPLKVIYPLTSTIQIPLTEVSTQTADLSFQRQFAEGNWLRELPNGVKDTVEKGKVIRRIGKMTLTGNENNWNLLSTSTGWSDDNNVLAMDMLNVPKLKKGAYFIHDNPSLATLCGVNSRHNNTHYIMTWAQGSNIGIGVKRSLLKSQDLQGLKAWLTNNPITILFELANPEEETLTETNYILYPYHKVNSYCGSMYVGEGRNHLVCDNKLPSNTTIIVDTEFREIEDKAKVEDCKYKKCADGYNDMCLMPTNKNLFDGVFEPGIIKQDGTIDSSSSTTRKYSKNYIRVIPGETYIFSANKGEDKINLRLYDINRNLMSIFPSYSNVFTIPTGCYYVRFYNGHPSDTDINTLNAQFEIGTKATTFINGKNVFRSYENTEENDIEDLRHQVSLTGFNYNKILTESFDKLLRGEL